MPMANNILERKRYQMSYEKRNWLSGMTPISKSNLEAMDDAVFQNSKAAETIPALKETVNRNSKTIIRLEEIIGDDALSKLLTDSLIASALSKYLEKHPIEGVGSDGITPHIGANGNWFIGDEDTGVKANGEDGQDGKTPVLGVDYFTDSDKEFIVSSVIDYFGGRPLYGFVDENNRIVVSGNLGDGTYTVKYELEDGTTVDIGELTLGGTSDPDEPEVPEVNNYFNKDTAQLNFRLGSNGTSSAYDGMVTTDFIEYTDDMTGKRFYASGIEPVMSSQYNYNARVVYYDSNKTKVAEFNDSYSNIFDEDVGVLTTYGAFTGDGYIRISLVVKDNASITSADIADLSITLK